MREHFKPILEAGLSITVPYKKRYTHDFSEVKICWSHVWNCCCIYGEYINGKFPTIEEGVDFFIREAFSSKNLGLIISRLQHKNKISSDDMEIHWNRKTGKFDDEYQTMLDKLVEEEKELINKEKV